jgi:hypothetical protein
MISQSPGSFSGLFLFPTTSLLSSDTMTTLAGRGEVLKSNLMKPYIENRHHVRELIRAFARVDECFDCLDPRREKVVESEFDALNKRLGSILAFPLKEFGDDSHQGRELLTQEQVNEVAQHILVQEDCESAEFGLREGLRDKLYEFLIRMDHCTPEQLISRGILIPPKTHLCLVHLQQLVVYLIGASLANLERSDENRIALRME